MRPEDQFTAKCLCHSEQIIQLLTLVVFILVKQSDLLLVGVCLMFKPILTQICHLGRKLYLIHEIVYRQNYARRHIYIKKQ